jgi:hypothetical protein
MGSGDHRRRPLGMDYFSGILVLDIPKCRHRAKEHPCLERDSRMCVADRLVYFLNRLHWRLVPGGVQYLLLHRLAAPFGWWFWATAAPPLLIAGGKAMFYVVFDSLLFRPLFDLSDNLPYMITEASQLTELALSGFITGLLQWMILRKVICRAAWWIPAAALVYFPAVITNLICRYIIIEHFQQSLGPMTAWFIFVLISGFNIIITQGALLGWLLVWLLKRPPPLEAEAEYPGE